LPGQSHDLTFEGKEPILKGCCVPHLGSIPPEGLVPEGREVAASVEAGQQRTSVLFDPHPLWLDALEPILRSLGVAVVGRTTSPENALELVEDTRPDLLICDMNTLDGGMNGDALIRACLERVNGLRVIVLGASRDDVHIDAAFDAGAVAYALKTARAEDVAATVRQAFDHTIFFARRTSTNGGAVGRIQALEPEEAEELVLTRREREILVLVAEGHSNRELARRLWVTEQTVKFHLSNIYRKLDVANRTEASRWAHRHGFVSS
jgi:DNA-binding NarL/FixJ family response regulator